jgi:predicted Ser/Thr protein kinase
MDPERLRKARQLFEDAMETGGVARTARLDQCSEEDPELRAAVERMIAADRTANAVLDRSLYLSASKAGEILPAGSEVGPYRIVHEIASGGMGTVYKADGRESGGLCALKVMRWASTDLARRFEREGAILSRLSHPNIARLLDTGKTPDGRLYFVMEYIEGEPVLRFCKQHSLAVEDRLRLFRQICAAVRYLHQNLVVHRDLKPANILVTAEGIVKVIDFGISKLLESEVLAAETGSGLMTPDYASPEQIRGEPVSTLTDVYALGILLYEMLAGTNPFASAGVPLHETFRRICEEEAPRPSTVTGRPLSAKFAEELDNMVLKALRKEPDRRYASVEQFDEDVRRHLAGLPVTAHGDSVLYQARKFIARHKPTVVAAAVSLILLFGGIVSTGFEAGVARRERERAETHARNAEQARVEAEVQRGRAEAKAAEAELQRATAERRLAELTRLAHGAVRVYNSTVDAEHANEAAPLIAEDTRDALLALRAEGAPGLEEMLDRTSAAARSFELAADPSWKVPRGWSASESVSGQYRVGIDRQIVHSGTSSLFLRSLARKPEGIVTAFQQFSAVPYRGRRVRVSAFLRCENAESGAELWLWSLGSEGAAEKVAVRGTTRWQQYQLVMDVPGNADRLGIWLAMSGPGTVWADDFSFSPVSKAVPLSRTRRQPENLNFTNSR